MGNSILANIIGAILRMLPDNALRVVVGPFIDKLENHIKNDGVNNWEDTAVIPLLEAAKRQLGIVATAPEIAKPESGASAQTTPAV